MTFATFTFTHFLIWKAKMTFQNAKFVQSLKVSLKIYSRDWKFLCAHNASTFEHLAVHGSSVRMHCSGPFFLDLCSLHLRRVTRASGERPNSFEDSSFVYECPDNTRSEVHFA